VETVSADGKVATYSSAGSASLYHLSKFDDTPPHLCHIISSIKKSRGEELAGVLSWNVLRKIICEEVSCWITPSKDLVTLSFNLLKKISNSAVSEVTKKHPS